MPRKPAKPVRAIKPPLPAICAAFMAGHDVRFTPQGPRRDQRIFATQYLQKAMNQVGASRTRAAEVLAWMKTRGLVEQKGASYVLTDKGAHVTDRACKVFAKRGR